MTQVLGPKELVKDVLEKDLCIGCGACVGICPYFVNHKGKTVMLFPCTLDKGRCYAFCPKAGLDLDELSKKFWDVPYGTEPLGFCKRVIASQAGEKIVNRSFQSGGVVSALMTFALDAGLIDAAVLTDREGLVPVPRLVTKPNEVQECATSKYMAAPTLSALSQGTRLGFSQMGLVGTPCQVMAAAKMSTNPLASKDFENPVALVVGLFCTWALDTKKAIAFLSQRMDISRIRKMDIPPPPAEVLVIETDEGKHEIFLEEIRPLVPHSCSVCMDMTSEWADVSVGVLEGKPTWNTLIVRSEKGEKLVEEAARQGYILIDQMPSEQLEHLRFAASNKRKRGLIQAEKAGLLGSTNEGERVLLRIRDEVVARITA